MEPSSFSDIPVPSDTNYWIRWFLFFTNKPKEPG